LSTILRQKEKDDSLMTGWFATRTDHTTFKKKKIVAGILQVTEHSEKRLWQKKNDDSSGRKNNMCRIILRMGGVNNRNEMLEPCGIKDQKIE
jgi:hypothetical protein